MTVSKVGRNVGCSERTTISVIIRQGTGGEFPRVDRTSNEGGILSQSPTDDRKKKILPHGFQNYLF
jgi:hypothetical protein